ncbi:MAG: hypothetical protein ACRDCW_06670 [Sarcina sp.]
MVLYICGEGKEIEKFREEQKKHFKRFLKKLFTKSKKHDIISCKVETSESEKTRKNFLKKTLQRIKSMV